MGEHAVAGWSDADVDQLRSTVRGAGARFAYLHGSRVHGGAREGSDLDVAAWFDGAPVAWWSLGLPDEVDLAVLELLPLAVAGRVALQGVLLFDDDPPARVRWEADTRLRYFDESWRRAVTARDFLAARGRG